MKRKLFNLSRYYQAALRTHLRQGQRAHPETAQGLGRQAVAAGLQTLDLAGAPVSAAGVAKLQKSLPELRIDF